MRYRSFEFRSAEVILNANYRLKKEIDHILTTLELEPPTARGAHIISQAHRQIQRAFEQQGWQTEVLVTQRTAKRHHFDLYKDRVGIEIEISNRELLYRDYMRFHLSAADGRLDVGVIVLLDEEMRFPYLHPPRNGAPCLDDVVDDLNSLRHVIDVPIWVVSLFE